MATGLPVGGDLEQALEDVGVPSYVLDTTGVIRWINPAAERLVGDVRGRQFTSVVAPEDRPARPRAVLPEGARHRRGHRRVRPSWSRRPATRVAVEISAVPLMSGEQVVGVFGLFAERPDDSPTAPHPHLTPRQVGGASSAGAGPLDEADRSRAPPEHRDGQEPHPPSLSGARRQFSTRSRRRRPGRIARLSDPFWPSHDEPNWVKPPTPGRPYLELIEPAATSQAGNWLPKGLR